MKLIQKWMLFLLLCASTPVFAQEVHEWTDLMVPLQAPLNKTTVSEVIQESGLIVAPFNGVLVDGEASRPWVRGFIRFFEQNRWSEPYPMSVSFMGDTKHFVAAYRGEQYRQGVRFQVRFQTLALEAISLHEAGIFNNLAEEEFRLKGTTREAIVPPSGRFKAPTVVRRTDWGARAFGDKVAGCGSPDPQPYYRNLTLHHTAWPVAEGDAASIKNMKDIQNFHMNDRGWCDVGYQFLMDRRGKLYQGRPWVDEKKSLKDAPSLVIGAHVSNGNTGNIGLSLMGCFHPPENTSSLSCLDKPSSALLDSVVTYFTYMADTYQVLPENIKGHRDFNATSCPGDNNYALLQTIRDRVKANLAKPPAAIFSGIQATLIEGDRTKASLSWVVSNEEAGVSYTIQRKGGTGAYTTIQTIQGTKAGTYTFTDFITTCEQNVSYTILANAIDKTQTQSTVAQVIRPKLAEGAIAAKVEPNGLVDVDWMVTKNQGAERVEIMRLVPNVLEGAVMSAVVYQGKAKELDTFIDRLEVPVKNLSYQLQVVDAANCREVLDTQTATYLFPENTVLAPPYPNPFNPSAVVRYFLKEGGAVTVNLFDMQGRNVQRLVQAQQAGNQWYRVLVMAEGLASGTYLVVLAVQTEAGQTLRQTQKLVLAR